MRVFKTEDGVFIEDGTKLYPVADWERNQHKIYNAIDRVTNEMYDAEDDPDVSAEEWNKLVDRRDELEEALGWFDRCIIGRIAYAPYRYYAILKDVIWAYNARG